MKSVIVFLFALLLGSAACTECFAADAIPKPRILYDKDATFTLWTEHSKCSATAVAINTFITAAHCLDDAGLDILLNKTGARILRVAMDGNDHILVLVDGVTFAKYATFGPALNQERDIHYWGNPSGLINMYRRGYVSGFEGLSTVYDVNGYHGDSGAGVFDNERHIVGVISFIYNDRSFAVMGSYPLNFTNEQLKAVGLEPNSFLTVGPKVPVAND